jgi:DNA polymerase
MELPSGRKLSYPGIGISVEKQVLEDEDNADGKITYRERIRFMGVNPLTKKWGKRFTYGGSLVENVTQALCRDVLAGALVHVETSGWPVILHIHDEIVTEVPNIEEYSVKELERMMCILPDWAAGFPLAAEGAELMRYAK